MWYQKRVNKYNAQRTEYNGRTYRSKLEAGHAEYLDWLVKAGEVKSWEYEKKMELYAFDKHICDYKVDFTVYYTDGHKEYQETKGLELGDFKFKWKLAEANVDHFEPDAKLVLIKENYNFFKHRR